MPRPAKFTGWKIVVGLAAIDPIFTAGEFFPTGDYVQKDIRGNLIFTDFILSSFTLGNIFESATFFYDRLSQASPVPTFRKAYVNILANNEVHFVGQIQNVQESHDRVTLQAVGIGDLINALPITGVLRERFQTLPLQNTFSTFNEQGKADAQLDAEGTGNIVANDNPKDRDLIPWTSNLLVEYLLKLMGTQQLQTVDFDFNLASVHMKNKLFANKIEDNKVVVGGILDEIEELATEDGQFLILRNVQGQGSRTSTTAVITGADLEIRNRFVVSQQADIEYNIDETVGDVSILGIPFEVNITKDHSTPDRLIVYSGKQYVQTTIIFDPSDVEHFEEVADEFSTSLIFRDVGIATDEFMAGGERWVDIFGSNKATTFSSISPRISNYDEIIAQKGELAIQTVSDWEIFYEFKDEAFKPGYVDKDKFFLQGSEKWDQGIKEEVNDSLTRIDGLNWDPIANKLEFKLTGFNQSGDASFKTEDFKDVVNRVIIPITIEVDNRLVVEVKRVQRILKTPALGIQSMFEVTDVTGDPVSAVNNLTYDYRQHSYEMIVEDNFRPMKRVAALQTYEDGELIIITDEVNFIDELKEIAKRRHSDIVFSDGSSMTLTIPIELAFEAGKLGVKLPTTLGNWLQEIKASPESGHREFSGYSLPRPLSVMGATYTNTDVTFSFS